MLKANVQHLDRLDRWIFGVAALLFTLSVWLVSDDRILFRFSGGREGSSESIAVLHRKDNDVRRRFETDVAFLPVDNAEKMYQGDAVFTGTKSEAELEFRDGSKITLETGSLVVIQSTAGRGKSGAKLNIQKGTVSGHLAEGQSIAIASASGKETELKASGSEDTQIQVSIEGTNGPQVTVLKGQAAVATETGSITLEKNQSTKVAADGTVAKIQYEIELQSPSSDQVVWREGSKPIEFSWINLNPTQKPTFRLEVSADRSFSKVAYQTTTGGERTTIQSLPETGVFYWRVKALDVGGEAKALYESPVQRFVVLTEKAPRLTLPKDGDKLSYLAKKDADDSTGSKVMLTWTPGHDAEPVDAPYLIEISKGQRDTLWQRGESKTNQFETQPLAQGLYFWKVKINDPARPKAMWSEVRSFKVDEGLLSAPKLLAPLDKQKFLKKNNDIKVIFEYKLEGLSAQDLEDKRPKYDIQVATAPNFSDDSILDKDTVKEGRFEWEASKLGTYYWRVRSVLRDGTISQYSDATRFDVVPWEAPKAPRIDAQTIHLSKKALDDGKLPEIKWTRLPEAKSYEIELSKSKDFTDPWMSEKSNYTTLPLPKRKLSDKDETVFARVRARVTDEDLSQWSDPEPVFLTWQEGRLKTPSGIAPRGGQTFEVDPDATTPVTLEWGTVQEAESYEFEVAKDNQFKDIIDKDEQKGQTFEIDHPPMGRVFWRVKAKNRYSESAWAGPFVFTRKEVSAEPQALPAPTLLAPLGRIFLIEETDSVTFKWDAVKDAKEYELIAVRKPGSGTPIDPGMKEPPAIKRIRTRKTSIDLVMPKDGLYTWQIKAFSAVNRHPLTSADETWAAIDPSGRGLASVAKEANSPGTFNGLLGSDPSAEQKKSQDSLASTASFELLRHQLDKKRPGYLALSAMAAPYTYELVKNSGGGAFSGTGRAASSALTVSLSGEYWWRPRWGVGGGFDNTVFSINGKTFNRVSAQALLKHRLKFQELSGWHLAPFVGVEARQYFVFTPLSFTNFWTGGPVAGFDFRKTFTDRLSIGVKAQYYIPVMLSGLGTPTSLTSDLSYRNFSTGVQGFYWLNPRFGFGAGAFLEMRSVSYRADNAATSVKADRITLDGSYFYGSAVYRFGQ